MTPIVSIIVPIYNAEAYIHRCVDSILTQEYKDFELLLIDDGSTDSSGAICDQYAQQDSRVCVVHKKNSGVSDTRNLALGIARGIYLQFLDSDDWITPDATKLLMRATQEHDCDLVIADFYRVVGDRVARKGDIEENRVLTREEFAEHMMENPADFYYGVLWNKLYRREIVEKFQLRMDSRISWCEDFMFNLEYIMHAERFYALQAPIYYYLKRKGSLVSQGTSISKAIKMKLMVFEYYNNFFKNVYDEKDYEKKRLQVYRFLVDAANDNGVLLPIFPGSKKLGNERSSVNPDIIYQDGIFMEVYRSKKLLERYLEVIALKNDLSLRDVKLLLCLKQLQGPIKRKELADFMEISLRNLSMVLQKLALRELIQITDIRHGKPSEKFMQIEFLPSADPILEDMTVAENDVNQVYFTDFSETERQQYENYNSRIKENILNVLNASYFNKN